MRILKGMRVSHRITDLHNFVCNSFIEKATIWKKRGKKGKFVEWTNDEPTEKVCCSRLINEYGECVQDQVFLFIYLKGRACYEIRLFIYVNISS